MKLYKIVDETVKWNLISDPKTPQVSGEWEAPPKKDLCLIQGNKINMKAPTRGSHTFLATNLRLRHSSISYQSSLNREE